MSNYNESDVPSAGGGAGTLPLDAFLDPGSGDDFAGTSLDGNWSSLQTTPLSAVDASVDGFVILKNTGNTGGQDRGIQRPFAPAGDFELWTKINYTTMLADFQWTGLFIGAANPSDSAGGNRLELIFVHNGPTDDFKFAKYAAGVETVVFGTDVTDSAIGIGLLYMPLWFRIKRVGSTITAGWSLDGVQFIDHVTTTTIGFTVATCGLILGESSASNNVRAVYDYLVDA